jgi:dethiobiotin synthetase
MRVIVVTGTDTGVGKTIVTAALAALALARERVAVVKPAQTGDDDDVGVIARLTGVTDLHVLARYPEPLAPATAARRCGRPAISPREVADYVRGLDAELVLIEGAGGLLVRFDDEGGTLADVAALLEAPVVVVARAGLGTLNHTALTVEALRVRGIECAGVVIGSWPADPDLAAECNLEDLAAYAGARVLGRVPENAASLTREAFLAAVRANMEADGGATMNDRFDTTAGEACARGAEQQ